MSTGRQLDSYRRLGGVLPPSSGTHSVLRLLDPEAVDATFTINSLHAELNLICHLLALLGAHHIFHVCGLRVKSS